MSIDLTDWKTLSQFKGYITGSLEIITGNDLNVIFSPSTLKKIATDAILKSTEDKGLSLRQSDIRKLVPRLISDLVSEGRLEGYIGYTCGNEKDRRVTHYKLSNRFSR